MAGLTLNPGEKDPRRIADAVRQLAEGRSNAVGTFTLTPSATTTTVMAPTCAVGSVVAWWPQTQHAANDMATTSYVSGAGQFILTHANNPRVDRIFSFVIAG